MHAFVCLAAAGRVGWNCSTDLAMGALQRVHWCTIAVESLVIVTAQFDAIFETALPKGRGDARYLLLIRTSDPAAGLNLTKNALSAVRGADLLALLQSCSVRRPRYPTLSLLLHYMGASEWFSQ